MKGLRSKFFKTFLTFIYIHPNHFASMELDERIEKEIISVLMGELRLSHLFGMPISSFRCKKRLRV